MLEDIKKELLKYPEKLREVLEHYGYCNVIIRPNYMQFGRDEFSSKKSIVIRLENNDYLYVHDYARSFKADIFTFITTQRKVEFVDVLNTIKKVLNISDYSDFFGKKGIFFILITSYKFIIIINHSIKIVKNFFEFIINMIKY